MIEPWNAERKKYFFSWNHDQKNTFFLDIWTEKNIFFELFGTAGTVIKKKNLWSKKVFSLAGVGKSPAKLDYKKINFLNIHYLKNLPKDKIFALYLKQTLVNNIELNPNQKKKIYEFFGEFIDRSSSVNDLFENTNWNITYNIFENLYLYRKNSQLSELSINKIEKIKEILNLLIILFVKLSVVIKRS